MSDESESQENEADEALKQAMEKPEDERTDADWELLAKALEDRLDGERYRIKECYDFATDKVAALAAVEKIGVV